MLMNPTLGTNTHPLTSFGQDPARQELNRLFYGPEFFRPEMIDRYRPEYIDRYRPEYVDRFRPEYSDRYRPEFSDRYRSEFSDRYRPEYYDRYRSEIFDRPIGAAAYLPTAPYASSPWGFYPSSQAYAPGAYAAYPSRSAYPYFRAEEPAMRTVEFNNVLTPETGALCLPHMNLAETTDAYLAVIELPGIDLKDLNLQVQGACLVLTAYRRPIWSNGTITVNYHCAEGHFGTFRRVLPIPPTVAPSQIQANFLNGLLTIVYPKNAPTNGSAPVANIVINSAVPTTV